VVPSTVPPDRIRTDRYPSSRGDPVASTRLRGWLHRGYERFRGLSAEWRDAFLYGCSTLFALVAALAMGIPLYRQWGQLAVGPYGAATALMAAVAWRVGRRTRPGPGGAPVGEPTVPGRGRRWTAARVAAFLIVLVGATLVPLSLEVVWRSEGQAALHVQPEVTVVEHAGARAAGGKDPYLLIDRGGRVLIHPTDEPVYELYFPYLPGMVIFGLASEHRAGDAWTDARLEFLVFTVLVSLLALSRMRPPSDARGRAFQVLTVLPTAALPLVTGGDDMPVAALMLLGLVALQRRRPVLAGLALGAASSLKFTAWAVLVFALWGARDLQNRRAVGRYLLGVVAVAAPVVFPLALRNVPAFIDNVIRFPLGLAQVSSPAGSALPGHILVSAVPGIHRLYVVVLAVVGVVVVGWLLVTRPPRNAAEVARFTGWVMLAAIMLAPATRVGYLLYPINLFIWTWMFRRADDPPSPEVEAAQPVGLVVTAASTG
jgi:MYXO-CTERM domain-containing protein